MGVGRALYKLQKLVWLSVFFWHFTNIYPPNRIVKQKFRLGSMHYLATSSLFHCKISIRFPKPLKPAVTTMVMAGRPTVSIGQYWRLTRNIALFCDSVTIIRRIFRRLVHWWRRRSRQRKYSTSSRVSAERGDRSQVYSLSHSAWPSLRGYMQFPLNVRQIAGSAGCEHLADSGGA